MFAIKHKKISPFTNKNLGQPFTMREDISVDHLMRFINTEGRLCLLVPWGSLDPLCTWLYRDQGTEQPPALGHTWMMLCACVLVILQAPIPSWLIFTCIFGKGMLANVPLKNNFG